jgi:signal transduction histidine kinase
MFQKQKKDLINETQAFERNQFSMELHDGLAQQLVALNLYLVQLETDISENNKERYLICKQLVSESLQQTRTLCYTVSPPELEEGLVMGIKALYERLNRLNGVIFIFSEDLDLYHVSLDNIDNYNVYRIIQEFSNNSIKHANCSEISCELKLDRNKKSLKILLNDNGIGFDFEKIKYGFGIQNMKKRANLMNAKITITSKIGIGSTLKLSLSL